MYSTEVQAKPLFSWEAPGWALLYFWFFSTLLQVTIYVSDYSGTSGIHGSLLLSSLWLIPVFLFPKRIKIIAAVIDAVLWVASLAALCHYIICGQGLSQSVLFVMFETNTNEASGYLSQYFSLKVVLIVLAYTAVAILLWTHLYPVYIPKPWRCVVSFALLYGLILRPIAMNTSIKNRPFGKMSDNLISRMEPAAPWQFLTGYYQYRQQLNSLTKLPNENNTLPSLVNFKDESGDEPRTLVLVVGESTQCGRMGLYGYPCETMSKLGALHKTDPDLTVFNNVVTSRPYTIKILQQALTSVNEKNPDLYLTQPSLINMMKRAGYKTFWITSQQTMTAHNTMLTVFSRQTDKQYYMNQQRMQSARKYDTNVLKLFQEVPKDPALKKLIVVHLLSTHIEYKCRYPEDRSKFDDNTEHVPPELNAEGLESYNDYDNANLYNDHVVTNLIKDFKTTSSNGFLVYFSDHDEKVYDTPPHKTQGCNEDNPTRHMYTIPFLLWTLEKWQATHPCDLSQDVGHKYNLAGLIHVWSGLAGLSYGGCDPTRSVVNPQFKEIARWIDNPYKKNALIDYGTLPYGNQVGNQQLSARCYLLDATLDASYPAYRL